MSIRPPNAALAFLVFLTFFTGVVKAQGPTDSLPSDPGAVNISLSKVQDLCFGAFAIGPSGGSITISNTGMRTVTGSVIPLNFGSSFFNAVFEVDAPEGTIITIVNGPDATLTGSRGGTMTLTLGPSSPASPFTTTAVQPARTTVNVGGTLTIGSSGTSPPGQYTGSFQISMNYQ